MNGYDTHFLQLSNSKKQFKGLLVFNQDAQDSKRVNLLHLTSISAFEDVLDLSLDYIWKTMHCQSIRVYLHHFVQDGVLKVNEEIKSLLKQRRFKWKTLKNETSTGMRIEIMEGLNLEYKEQLDRTAAFIYRRDLNRDDLFKDTMTYRLTTSEGTGPMDKSLSCLSLPAMIAYHDKKELNLESCRSELQQVADIMRKDNSKLFSAMFNSNIACF